MEKPKEIYAVILFDSVVDRNVIGISDDVYDTYEKAENFIEHRWGNPVYSKEYNVFIGGSYIYAIKCCDVK